MESENRITDQQLDAMLRNIDVPADLKDRLLEIPGETETETDLVQPAHGGDKLSTQGHSTIVRVVLAASLVAVAAILGWTLWPRAATDYGSMANAGGSTGKSSIDSSADTTNPDSRIIAEHLAALDVSLQQVEDKLLQLELGKLQAQVNQLSDNRHSLLSRVETDSMIAALSEQAAIPFGGSEKNVQLRMSEVIQRYPGSRGAEIAQNFLKQMAN